MSSASPRTTGEWSPSPVAADRSHEGSRPSAGGLGTVWIRRVRTSDRGALEAMFARCSAETRYRRFLGPRHTLPEPYLTEVLFEAGPHISLVAEVGRKLVALATLSDAHSGVAELGVFVEDDYQRQGIGAALLRRLIDHADRCGCPLLRATVLAEQAWIVRFLASCGPSDTVVSFGVTAVLVCRL